MLLIGPFSPFFFAGVMGYGDNIVGVHY